MKGIISNEIIEIVIENILHPTGYDVMSGNANHEYIKEFATKCAGILIRKQQFPEDLKICLTEFLLQIGAGKSPDIAFHIKKGAKRKADNGRNRAITFAVILGIVNKKMKVKDAIYETSLAYETSPDTVTKVYYRHRKEVESTIIKAKKQRH